eukprot:Platyproteum_vivax@DN5153_c0_g1_i2.p1
MSQFRDTFTKEDKKDSLLDYDDSAFLYFAMTVLVCLLVPLLWNLLHTIFSKRPDHIPSKTKEGSKLKTVESQLYKSKLKEHQQWVARESPRFGAVFFAKLIMAFVMIFFAYLCVVNMADTSDMKGFDPFVILGVPQGASPLDIKKAYRVQSLKHHPDKNPNDPLAASKFNLIHKAYEVLTNEQARKNFERYGNPDGPSAMKVGMGLPRILVEEDNQLAFLIIFFLIILVIVPSICIWLYQRQRKYAPNGVQLETLSILAMSITEQTRIRQAVELLAASAESRELQLRPTDDVDMRKIIDNVEDVSVKKMKYNKMAIIVRNVYLITAHLQRLHEDITPPLMRDLQMLLKDSIKITNSMVEIALLRNWVNTAYSMVEFRRCLIQAIASKSHELLQIPHVSEGFIRNNMKLKSPLSLMQFLSNETAVKKLVEDLTPEQAADVEAFVEGMPRVEITARIGVEDETDIVVGDVATVTVKFVRQHLKDSEVQGPVHAPFFPLVKFEEWYLFLVEPFTEKMLTMHKTSNYQKEFEEELQFQILKQGKQTIALKVMSDSYAGLDKQVEINFTAFTEQEVKRKVVIHPDDLALDDEPTLFQQMMGSLHDNDVSSDEEEVEEQHSKLRRRVGGALKKIDSDRKEEVYKKEAVISESEEEE